MYRRFRFVLGIMCFIAFLGARERSVQAQTIYNFQIESRAAGGPVQYQGTGALGAGGAVFNSETATSGGNTWAFSSALTSTGASSSVGLTVTAAGSTAKYVSLPTSTQVPALLGQYAYAGTGAGEGTFTLTNLAANASFTLYLYGVNAAYEDRGTDFAISTPGATADQGIDSTLNTTDTAFIEGDNYVIFYGTTSAAGTISGTFSGNTNVVGNTESDFNGLQLQMNAAAPEPATAALTGAFALPLFAAWSRRARRGRLAAV